MGINGKIDLLRGTINSAPAISGLNIKYKFRLPPIFSVVNNLLKFGPPFLVFSPVYRAVVIADERTEKSEQCV